MRLPKELVPGKFDSRSLKCWFVGYGPNGYKFWSTDDRKIIYERDAVCETKFSFENLSSDPWIYHEEKDETLYTKENKTIKEDKTEVEGQSDKSEESNRSETIETETTKEQDKGDSGIWICRNASTNQ